LNAFQSLSFRLSKFVELAFNTFLVEATRRQEHQNATSKWDLQQRRNQLTTATRSTRYAVRVEHFSRIGDAGKPDLTPPLRLSR
jgi:hypothetical protein